MRGLAILFTEAGNKLLHATLLKYRFVLIFLFAAHFIILPAKVFAEQVLRYSWNMDTDPGWSTEGLWAYGKPEGKGGSGFDGHDGHGGPDPSSGYTGDYVYGYNLSGNYENDLEEKNLTSTAINCSGLSQVTLKFRRWLGVEESSWDDHAYVRVSNDGIHWTTKWENPVVGDITDASWSLQTFDISSIADGQPTVYLRWTMGATGQEWQYCGWNIDDVEIWSASTTTAPTAVTGSATAVSSNSATLHGTVNPNGTSTTVTFGYRYDLPFDFWRYVTAAESPLSGTSDQDVSAQITGLQPGRRYAYQVIAESDAGTTMGSEETFITKPDDLPGVFRLRR